MMSRWKSETTTRDQRHTPLPLVSSGRRRSVGVLLNGAEAELLALFGPVKRQACIIHEAARGEFRWVLARQDGADDVGGKEGQAIEARRVGWDDVLGLRDLLKREAAVINQPLA